MSKFGKFLLMLAVMALVSLSAYAAEINSPTLGTNGWFSDDTRADGSGSQLAGTNLISTTYTAAPENGSGNPAHDADILAQLLFGPAPAGYPGGTHPGSVNLWIDAIGGGSGKSQISHRKDDGFGHAAGTVLDDPGFFVDYYWMGNGGLNFSAAFKIGFKTSEFGSAPVSPRTGENVWDKLLIFEPNNLGAHPSNGTWWHEQVSRTSGTWWVFDRVRGYGGQPQFTLAALEASTANYNGNVAFPTYGDLYDLMAGGIVTTVQLGIGSANAGANVYVNQLETSFYRIGDVTTFGSLPVHNITQSVDYLTIPDAVAAANSGDIIELDAGTHATPGSQVLIDKSLTIRASNPLNKPVIVPTANTGTGGDARAWFLVQTGYVVNFEDLHFDGDGFLISGGIHTYSSGSVARCEFENIGYNPSTSYAGRAVMARGDISITMEDNVLSNIGRIGLYFYGTGTNPKVCRRNTYTGKGDGNWLDYGIEIEGGAVVQVENNSITNCTGIALSDGSGSAALLATTYFATGTGANLTGNIMTDNSVGPYIGYDASDVTTADIYSNKMENNEYDVVSTSTVTVDASGNWWGQSTEPTIPVVANVTHRPQPIGANDELATGGDLPIATYDGDVDYSPWLDSGTDTNVGAGFQGDFSVLHVSAASPVTGSTNHIQEAVDMVSGSTVLLTAGTYEGQVVMSGFADIHLIGSGVGNTFVHAPVSLPHFYTITPNNNRAILSVENCTAAEIKNLSVNGLGRGSGNYRFMGIAYFNSGGSVENVDVAAIRETPLNGTQHGVGVYAFNSGSSKNLALTNVNVSDCQKNAFTLAGNLVIDAENMTALGAGPTAVIAQNGIQVSSGASGTFVNCDATGFEYTPYSVTSTGYLIFGPTTVSVAGADIVDCQSAFYALDANVTFDDGSISYIANSTSPYGIFDWKTAVLAGFRRVPAESDETPQVGSGRESSLDAPNSFEVTNSTITGDGQTGSLGIGAFSDAGNLTVVATNNDVSNWDQGIQLDVNGGTISSATVTGNSFSNTNNTSDDSGPHTWDSNCYSDYPSNDGYPGSYEIPGATPVNVDNNPNPNGCAEVNLVLSDDHIGCGGTCDETILYLTLGTAGIPNLQVVFELPAGFAVALPPMGVVTPVVNDDPNLIQAFAQDLGGGDIQVDMGFVAPYSTGDFTKYVAAIPLVSTAATGTYAIEINSTLWTDEFNVNHVDALTEGSAAIEVDCTPPVINSFVNTATCAFGSAAQTVDKFTINLSDANSTLDSAWVTFAPGGGSFALFGANQTSPYTTPFPSAANAAAFYALLQEDCNTLTLHMTDSECNVASTVVLSNVGRDNTAPSLAVSETVPANYCFNNDPLSANYGGAYLDNYIDITSALGANACMAATGTLTISNGMNSWPLALDQTNYPSNDGEALALWTWMLPIVGANNGASTTFDVNSADCAGNAALMQQFTICADTTKPQNAVTAFDARPAHLGVWLKWSWNAGPQAQEMRIYRSPLSGQYPGYSGDLWASVVNYDVSSVPPASWEIVATQTALSGTLNSDMYGNNNDKGELHYHAVGADSFWLDADASWVDGNGNSAAYRDIYRYVTFVKDAGGNWSVGDTVEFLENADRSTNYWLGDFSTSDADNGLDNSRGRIDTDDLGLLSPVYFSTGTYQNIGPVNFENGTVGKSIPNPDGGNAINFSDLVVFSFNYGVVSPVGITPTEFVVDPDPSQIRPFTNLDEAPVVLMTTDPEATFDDGSEFIVTVNLTGNESGVVKAVEAVLEYDDTRLEYVASTASSVTTEGTLFTKSALINNEAGKVGFVAAACGGVTTLADNAILGTVTFRVKRALNSPCELALTSVQMVDNTGDIRETASEGISILSSSAIPDNYALYQNYPNPFNPSTNIMFDLKESGHVTILVYNTLGQTVATVLNESLEAGRHDVSFDASSLASGLYIYTIQVNGFSDLKKMVLIR